MAPLPDGITYGQWGLVYNALSFGIAGMGSATIFFWLQLPNVTKNYRTALCITGLVTAIATYHYVRIFNSWVDAFEVNNSNGTDYTVAVSGAPFNDAYRYVDWLLTVPLLLIELILVMKLPKGETVALSWKLGVSSAIMVGLGYPGEIQDDLATRWIWWALAMVPFCYVVFTLVTGLSDATSKQPDSVKGLVTTARYLTVVSWCTYPFVYIVKNFGLAGGVATTAEQVGYSVADVVAKAVFGVLIWAIAAGKSMEEDGEWGSLVAQMGKWNVSKGALLGGYAEAARKLIGNHTNVLNDMTNPAPISQANLPRLSALDSADADEFLLALARGLLGQGGGKASSPRQKSVWEKAAQYLDKRIQADVSQCPGRNADMSPDAAQAMRSVMQQISESKV